MRKKSPRGFSLIEIMLTVTLLAIAGAIVAPNLLSGYHQQRIAAATWSVATSLEQARSRGLLGMNNAAATFTANQSMYTVGSDSIAIETGVIIETSAGIQFATQGTLLSPQLPATISLLDPLNGLRGTVTVATSGYISWRTGP